MVTAVATTALLKRAGPAREEDPLRETSALRYVVMALI
jgi:hypothetical protein